MWTDPIVEEIHRVREKQSSKYNYDVEAMIEALREKEKEAKRKFVTFPSKRIEKETT